MKPLLTDAELAIMRHTLGLDERHPERPPYRNHFVAGEGHADWPTLLILEARGLMERIQRPLFIPECDVVFRVTAAGQACGLSYPEPKLSRSQRRYKHWLDVADCFPDWEFRDWLKAGAERAHP